MAGLLLHVVVVVSCPDGGSSSMHVPPSVEEAQAGEGGGGRLKNGREERKRAVRLGRTHRSRGVRSVGWEGHENRCLVVCGAEWQEGQRLFGALPTLSR